MITVILVQLTIILIKNNGHFGYTKLTDIEKKFHNGHFSTHNGHFGTHIGHFGAKLTVILG